MKILFLADLHGNLPATLALEKQLPRIGADQLWYLGDAVGKGPSNAETCDWVRAHCDHFVGGNWDYGIGGKQFPADDYYWQQLGPERMAWLNSLPSEAEATVSGVRFRLFHGRPVTVLGHLKGSNLEENLACNFGMPGPEGYRKALRLMKQAEKFGRPVITFIDTPGAYPGMEAEERGQGEAIARNLAEMSRLRVPVISIVTGEGSSGGALALGLADRILMLENAYYSVDTPEGCASILWKDPKKRDEACLALKLTAQDLLGFGVIDGIIPEAVGGAQRDTRTLFERIDRELLQALHALDGKDADTLVRERYAKYRRIGLA